MIQGLLEPLTQREIILIGLLALILLVIIFSRVSKKKKPEKALTNLIATTTKLHKCLYDAFLEVKKLKEFFKEVEQMP